MKVFKCIAILICSVYLLSCGKETANTAFVTPKDVFPVQVGKVFLYRLDSTVPINFGASLGVRSYVIKDSVESSFTDAMGNESYRIYRYITDTAQANPFQFSATLVATFKNGNLEYVENNLRYVKLTNPVGSSNSWKGNIYINTIYGSPYDYLNDWNYRYDNNNQPFTCLKGTLDSTYTVFQIDEETSTPLSVDTVYHEKKYGIEVYAKNVGLVYKDFLFYIRQPRQLTSAAKYQDNSYGVKLNLISYK